MLGIGVRVTILFISEVLLIILSVGYLLSLEYFIVDIFSPQLYVAFVLGVIEIVGVGVFVIDILGVIVGVFVIEIDGVAEIDGLGLTGQLIEYLFKCQHFPVGAILSTGTGIVPPLDISLLAGDVVTITVDQIGTLVNKVVVTPEDINERIK